MPVSNTVCDISLFNSLVLTTLGDHFVVILLLLLFLLLQLSVLPAYAYYYRDRKKWIAGTGDVNSMEDIVSLIAGHT